MENKTAELEARQIEEKKTSQYNVRDIALVNQEVKFMKSKGNNEIKSLAHLNVAQFVGYLKEKTR